MTAAALLWLAHIGVAVLLGTASRGPLLSDVIQFALGGVLIAALADASRRSEGMARAFWNLAAAAYLLWMIAQALGVYNDLVPTPTILPLANLLFSFWFAPLAMALFLDPEHETGRLDALMALDFGQGVLVCIAAYLYFYYIPKAETSRRACRTRSGFRTSADTALVAHRVHSSLHREPLPRCACSVRTHGDLPCFVRMRRCPLLLRARQRDENRRNGSIFCGACCWSFPH